MSLMDLLEFQCCDGSPVRSVVVPDHQCHPKRCGNHQAAKDQKLFTVALRIGQHRKYGSQVATMIIQMCDYSYGRGSCRSVATQEGSTVQTVAMPIRANPGAERGDLTGGVLATLLPLPHDGLRFRMTLQFRPCAAEHRGTALPIVGNREVVDPGRAPILLGGGVPRLDTGPPSQD
jgi:hypothetical protein